MSIGNPAVNPFQDKRLFRAFCFCSFFSTFKLLSVAFCCREPLSKLLKTRYLLVHHIFQNFRNALSQIGFFAPLAPCTVSNRNRTKSQLQPQKSCRIFFLLSLNSALLQNGSLDPEVLKASHPALRKILDISEETPGEQVLAKTNEMVTSLRYVANDHECTYFDLS